MAWAQNAARFLRLPQRHAHSDTLASLRARRSPAITSHACHPGDTRLNSGGTSVRFAANIEVRGWNWNLTAALPLAGSSLGEDADVTIHSRPRITPEACPALVLNADFRPLSYYPLSLWSWQDSIKAVFLERVNIVSSYDKTVRSPSSEIHLPSVISLKTYVKASRFPAFTRFNVFLRD